MISIRGTGEAQVAMQLVVSSLQNMSCKLCCGFYMRNLWFVVVSFSSLGNARRFRMLNGESANDFNQRDWRVERADASVAKLQELQSRQLIQGTTRSKALAMLLHAPMPPSFRWHGIGRGRTRDHSTSKASRARSGNQRRLIPELRHTEHKWEHLHGGNISTASSSVVDEDLYSRQLYVLGHKAQRSLAKSSVLVLGLSGLGAEVAKNLALAGVGSLDVRDPTLTTHADLSTNFLLREDDVGTPRHANAAARLAPLNPYVRVGTVESEPVTNDGTLPNIDEALLSKYTVVVAVDRPNAELLQLDAACRRVGCRLVVCDSKGVFGRIFVDFGEGFVVDDVDGEEPKTALLEHVSSSDDGEVTCLREQPHGLVDGDVVRLEEVGGMPSLCETGRTFRVKVLSRHVVSIGKTTGEGTYTGGGRLVQVKQPRHINFPSLANALASPKILETQMDSHSRLRTIHACFANADDVSPGRQHTDKEAELATAALLSAVKKSGLLPVDQVDAQTVKDFVNGMEGSLSPMAAFIGGAAAQEVIKACTHRYTPLEQFLYIDGSSILPAVRPTAEETAPRGDRYDGQRAVLGQPLIEKLSKLNYFVVGAGAIGCELLKCLALMGVGSDAKGRIHVTDMDTIERSNLNRQFLFRPSDVGKAKSCCAAAAAKVMNPDLKISAYEERVGTDSGIFEEDFWRSLDGVANALDNVEARLYVDRCCVDHGLPLLESGTTGTMGNTQVVLPGQSESYGSSTDPSEPTIPVCTLKSFPYLIEHTLQWARDTFEGEFTQAPEAINQWLARPEYLDDLVRDSADNLPAAVDAAYEGVLARPSPADGASRCVAWARSKFDMWFDKSIHSLCEQFPADHFTETGEPFWSGTRRRPAPTPFDPNNVLHVQFVTVTARLRAQTLNLKPPSKEEVVALLSSPDVTSDASQEGEEGTQVLLNEDDTKARVGPSPNTLRRVMARMASLKGPDGVAARRRSDELRAAPESFEKDDDSNGHMEFITLASNLRAANYGIPQADMHKSKQIAGRIVPAIATTTACVVGLSCLELLKLIQYPNDIERFRNGFLNLALPSVAFSEPYPAEEYDWPGGGKNKKTWNIWSRIAVEPSSELTLQQLVDDLEQRLGLEISFLSSGATMLYSSLTPPSSQKTWLGKGVRSAVEMATGQAPRGETLFLKASCYDSEAGEDVDAPTIAYRVNKKLGSGWKFGWPAKVISWGAST